MATAVYVAVILAALLLVVWFVSVYSSYQVDIRRARQRVRSASRVADTPCGPVEYAVAGEGLPVLVVHGAGGGFDQGMDIAAPLVGRGFQLIATSRFGYLRTPLPADASAAAQADAHACLLDALNIERAVVVGASAGAPSAMQFALRHPQRTMALILLVPAAYTPRPGRVPAVRIPRGLRFLFDTVMRSDFLFWVLIRYAPRTAMRSILGTPPEDMEHANDEERAAVWQILRHVLPVSRRRHGLLNDAVVVSSLPRYELERIAAPTLIMSVEDDLYGTYEGARYSADHIPHARFVGYARGGHLSVGHQRETAAEIAAFLDGVRLEPEGGEKWPEVLREQA